MQNLDHLKARAKLLNQIRTFFKQKNILEVETPLLASAPVTDPYINAFSVDGLYLQTSPEYAMKRLLAMGSGSIYQICKAFRKSEFGANHNPEFTMLEWYHVDFDEHQLMDEITELLQSVISLKSINKYSYRELFENILQINPHQASEETLKNLVAKHIGLIKGLDNPNKNDYLQLLMSDVIEPTFQNNKLYFVHDYPASQAALAKTKMINNDLVAARFEAYIGKTELANGYFELTDPKEQELRFLKDLEVRKKNNIPLVPIDYNLIDALTAGLPSCAGVAIGLDRLLMLITNEKTLTKVLAFDIKSA